jgi:membrane protease YdiL (CAAX protease family)
MVLRTSYHVYYGVGFVATIPFAYFVTRSFQKHGRLTRPIVAHFLFDAAVFTIAILTS